MARLKYSRIVFGMAVLLAGVSAMGQYQIEQGRVLDANTRLGSGGLNYAQPQYQYNAGNRLMTGNVAGGRSFRGMSGISDPNAMFPGSRLIDPTLGSSLFDSATAEIVSRTSQISAYALPSSRLDTFRRDSFNVWDYRNLGYNQASQVTGYIPYYSTTSAVTNTGAIIAGRNRLGTSQVYNPYETLGAALPMGAVDPYAVSGSLVKDGSSLAVPSRLLRKVSGEPLSGGFNSQLLQSRLFSGAVRQVTLAELSNQRSREEALGADMTSDVTSRVDFRVKPFGPEDTRVEGTGLLDTRRDMRIDAGTGLDRVFERAAADGELRTGISAEAFTSPGAGRSALDQAAGLRRSPAGPFATTGDVFAKMRTLSRQLPQSKLARPYAGAPASQKPELTLVPKTVSPPITAPTMTPQTAESMAAAQESALTTIKTFVGTHDSVINEGLAQGEEKLQNKQFYRAAEQYQLTRSMAPDNPLPMLGNAMALLAAGDYMTAVNNLFDAIRVFESLSMFQIDLQSFVTDLDTLDRRRADLESRLEQAENFRLRFLLGWAEYCSGFKELGLGNMEKAMAIALPEKPESEEPIAISFTDEPKAQLEAVQRFVEALREQYQPLDRPIEVPTP